MFFGQIRFVTQYVFSKNYNASMEPLNGASMESFWDQNIGFQDFLVNIAFQHPHHLPG